MDADRSLWTLPQLSRRNTEAGTTDHLLEESLLLDAKPIFENRKVVTAAPSSRLTGVESSSRNRDGTANSRLDPAVKEDSQTFGEGSGDVSWGLDAKGESESSSSSPAPRSNPIDSLQGTYSGLLIRSRNSTKPPHQTLPFPFLLLGRDRQRSTTNSHADAEAGGDELGHARSRRNWNVPSLDKVREGRIEKRRTFDTSMAFSERSLHQAAMASSRSIRPPSDPQDMKSYIITREHRSQSRILNPMDNAFAFEFEPRVFGESKERQVKTRSKRDKSRTHNLDHVDLRPRIKDVESIDEPLLHARAVTSAIAKERDINIQTPSNAPPAVDVDTEAHTRTHLSGAFVEREEEGVPTKTTVDLPGHGVAKSAKEPTKARSFFAALKSKVQVEKPVDQIESLKQRFLVTSSSPLKDDLEESYVFPNQALLSMKGQSPPPKLVHLPILPFVQSSPDLKDTHDTRTLDLEREDSQTPVIKEDIQAPVGQEIVRKDSIDEPINEPSILASQLESTPAQKPIEMNALSESLSQELEQGETGESVGVTQNVVQHAHRPFTHAIYCRPVHKATKRTKALTVPIAPSFGRSTKSATSSNVINKASLGNPNPLRRDPGRSAPVDLRLPQPTRKDTGTTAASRGSLKTAHARPAVNRTVPGAFHTPTSAASSSSKPRMNNVFAPRTGESNLQTSVHRNLPASSTTLELTSLPNERVTSRVVKIPNYAAAHRMAEGKRREALQQGQSRLTKIEAGRTPGRTTRMRMQERAQHNQTNQVYHQRREEARERFLKEKGEKAVVDGL